MSMMLDRCNGPACPTCGCQDTEIVKMPEPSQSQWWGGGRAVCRHCHRPFHFREMPPQPEPEPIPEPVYETPDRRVILVKVCTCGAKMRVSSTRKRVRHYKCDTCGATAKAPRS